MAVFLSPVGLAAAATTNTLNVGVTFKEKLCKTVCAVSTSQPTATVTYRYEQPILQGTVVFVPIVATVTIITPGCGCSAVTQTITERFVLQFFGQTALPTSVTITENGMIQGLFKVVCGKSNLFAIQEGLTVTITPATTA